MLVQTITHYKNLISGNPELFDLRKLTYKTMIVRDELLRDAEARRNTLKIYYTENMDQIADAGLYLKYSNNKDSVACI